MNIICSIVLNMLNGSTFANVIMPWSKYGPVQLPDDVDARAQLVDAHIAGGPADVLYAPNGNKTEQVHVDALMLAGFTPNSNGHCSWLAIDLDAADGHGPGGLVDPVAAMRCIASAADRAGLFGGLLAARSRGGHGRHVWLFPPSPISLNDAVFAVAVLTTYAYKLAAADVADYACEHAFRRPGGLIARPGDPGAVELFPHSTERPSIGWALALPAAGAYRESGGGIIVDAYGDQPYEPDSVPRCDTAQWTRFLDDARATYKSKLKPTSRPMRSQNTNHDPLDRIDPRARQFLAGQVTQGARNSGAFTAACNLIGFGVAVDEVERLILAGAAGCGLPEHEARAAFKSAITAMRRKGVAT